MADTVLKLNNLLFANQESQAYAVLDGASVLDLLPQLQKYSPEHCCLFAGRLHPEVAQTAPYLVKLDQQSKFYLWLIEKGWGNHWGIYATLPASMPFKRVRKHFRSFLRVRSPQGDPMLFRFYDPRVLSIFLPTCTDEEKEQIFGPVTDFVMEGEADDVLQLNR